MSFDHSPSILVVDLDGIASFFTNPICTHHVNSERAAELGMGDARARMADSVLWIASTDLCADDCGRKLK
jgi:hypothetical protein